MTTEQLPQITPPSTPDTPKPVWSRRKTIAAVAIAVGVAGAGGVAIWAAAGSSTTTATDAGGPGKLGGQAPGGQGGQVGGAGILESALHGEYVASDGNGGYTTELMQTGKITELSATSLTAVSDDGFSKTYTIDAGTATGGATGVSGLATGESVTIVAATSGATATADSVTAVPTG
jgi:hypothetical protein